MLRSFPPSTAPQRRSSRLPGRALVTAASMLCALVALSGESLALDQELDKTVQETVVQWLSACDLNKELSSVTCAEIEKCLGQEPLKKSKDPLLYALVNDAAKQSDEACLPAPPAAESRKGKVVYGIGLATGLKNHRLGSTEFVDAEGNPLVAEFRGGATRPVITAGFLFPRLDDKKFRPGIMAVVDAEVFAEGSFVKPQGVGIGLTGAFLGGQAGQLDQAFGIGVAYMWESAKLPTEDPTPVLIDKTVNSVLLVVTYSLGKKWPLK